MKITDAFVIRFIVMKDHQRATFIEENKQSIDFTRLMHQLKQKLNDALINNSMINHEKITNALEDILLYEAAQRFSPAVSPIELVAKNPMPVMAVT